MERVGLRGGERSGCEEESSCEGENVERPEKYEAKKDPKYAHRHKVEEEINAAALTNMQFCLVVQNIQIKDIFIPNSLCSLETLSPFFISISKGHHGRILPLSAAAAVGAGRGFVFHEHHEKKEEEEAHGKKPHHLF
ncbi:hypothetical protein F2P56_033682 [Juglans regia]|nr:hypothetical protein F2P56_033682 [Juglans regia]